MDDDLSELYQQVILDHSRKPRHFHVLPEANRTAEGQQSAVRRSLHGLSQARRGCHPRHQLSRFRLRHFQGLGFHDGR
jgi:hypothetical protein